MGQILGPSASPLTGTSRCYPHVPPGGTAEAGDGAAPGFALPGRGDTGSGRKRAQNLGVPLDACYFRVHGTPSSILSWTGTEQTVKNALSRGNRYPRSRRHPHGAAGAIHMGRLLRLWETLADSSPSFWRLVQGVR